MRGAEQVEASKLEAVVTHKVTIPYRSGVTSDMRIKHGSRYFYPASVIDVGERHIDLELMCEEKTD